jgi:hypothetical protein
MTKEDKDFAEFWQSMIDLFNDKERQREFLTYNMLRFTREDDDKIFISEALMNDLIKMFEQYLSTNQN